jgi:PPOX class probable F420-dependent enzyme
MSSQATTSLAREKCISLTTYRKDGTAVSTPIWFNIIGDRLYCTTPSDSWKVKRIANNSRVQFAACTQRGKVTGATFSGTARIIGSEELPSVIAAKKKRYPSFRIIHRFKSDQAGIEITPDQN